MGQKVGAALRKPNREAGTRAGAMEISDGHPPPPISCWKKPHPESDEDPQEASWTIGNCVIRVTEMIQSGYCCEILWVLKKSS